MQSINNLPFGQLKNAEHVAFFNNVVIAIDKIGAEEIGLTAAKFTELKNAVGAEQDIVLKAQGSMYTADMQALDEERDRLYRMIRLKMQAVCLASPSSELAVFKAPLEKYILNKYGVEITSLAYQEESAHLSGFDLDVTTRFTSDELTLMGIDQDLVALKLANDKFADLYNQRATERSGSTAELTKKLRAESENLYGLIKLHIEYTANTEPASEKGVNCASALGVINEIVKDARTRLNQRLGRTSGDGSESGLDSNVSPIPFPNK